MLRDSTRAPDLSEDWAPINGEFIPTPWEIREACREIQAGWTPNEERNRRIGRASNDFGPRYRLAYQPAARWTPPVCRGLDAGKGVA